MTDLKIKIYSDGAELDKMIADYQGGRAKGFTTNPTLMKKAGVKDYVAFAKEALNAIPDLPISFEVFADDFETMEKEALKIASFGDNVYVKIPIVNTKGDSAIPLIKRLSSQGLSLNITAIMTIEQVTETVSAFSEGTTNVVSVFAGRIADTGIDPLPVMTEAVAICHSKAGTELLWASTRELLNIFQANQVGADIITSPPEILAKMSMVGMDLNQLSIETVKMFNRDIEALGFTIL
ncbi:transaldolase [Vagococcus sp. BWB3-3]|uniref:Transaldolase n=1 Tax=Vagococcus allomyrinae TaxID=2794353 RepID=A0A940P919_9ENTE|nr:transaldolase [Vagococcus allomyrinae]MBP1040689.1 transaldolase [Vagococcus allomyrinae]